MSEGRLMKLNGRMDMIGLMRRLRCQRELTLMGLYKGQFGILDYVLRNPGCTQREIADHMAVTASSVAKSTARMQRAGLLSKNVNESNLRCNKLYITDEGERISRQTRELFDRMDLKMFEGFSEEEIGLLESFLNRIINNMAESPEDAGDFNFEKICALQKRLRENEKEDEQD